MESRLAGGGHIIEDVSPLHSQRRYHGEDALHKAATARTVGAEAGLAPHHAMADAQLGGIVCWLDHRWFVQEAQQVAALMMPPQFFE